jgi:hypothetical protein
MLSCARIGYVFAINNTSINKNKASKFIEFDFLGVGQGSGDEAFHSNFHAILLPTKVIFLFLYIKKTLRYNHISVLER